MVTPETMAKNEAAPKKRRIRRLEKQQGAPEPEPANWKILCVLDPSRRMGSYGNTKVDASWTTVECLAPERVGELMECEGLHGFVFRQSKRKDVIRIYDWVSNTHLPSSMDTHTVKLRPTWRSSASRRADVASSLRLGRIFLIVSLRLAQSV